MESSKLARRVRFAYERARFLNALPLGGFGITLTVCALIRRSDLSSWTWGLGLVFSVVLVVFRWWGGVLARAVVPGVLSGMVPLLVSVLIHSSGHDGLNHDDFFCFLLCVAAGGLASVPIAVAARSVPGGGRWFTLAAGTLATLCGSMACTLYCLPGILGLITGVALVSAYGVIPQQETSRERVSLPVVLTTVGMVLLGSFAAQRMVATPNRGSVKDNDASLSPTKSGNADRAVSFSPSEPSLGERAGGSEVSESQRMKSPEVAVGVSSSSSLSEQHSDRDTFHRTKKPEQKRSPWPPSGKKVGMLRAELKSPAPQDDASPSFAVIDPQVPPSATSALSERATLLQEQSTVEQDIRTSSFYALKHVPAKAKNPALNGTIEFRVQPYAVVLIKETEQGAEKELGMTPLVPVEMPAGVYRVRFFNDELGISQIKRVEVQAGKHRVLKISLYENPTSI